MILTEIKAINDTIMLLVVGFDIDFFTTEI